MLLLSVLACVALLSHKLLLLLVAGLELSFAAAPLLAWLAALVTLMLLLPTLPDSLFTLAAPLGTLEGESASCCCCCCCCFCLAALRVLRCDPSLLLLVYCGASCMDSGFSVLTLRRSGAPSTLNAMGALSRRAFTAAPSRSASVECSGLISLMLASRTVSAEGGRK